MRRSRLSLITAGILLAGALIWLTLGRAVSAFLWVASSLGWWLTALVQSRKSIAIEPAPASCLLRRFSRLILFWS
jgi:hypothetical protein